MSTPCEYCATHGITTPATTEAYWMEPDGTTDGTLHAVCAECLSAGYPTGPGYRARCERLDASSDGVTMHYRVTHQDAEDSYSSRDAADLLRDAGLLRDGEMIEWIGGDLYDGVVTR